jgi:ribonucleotide monophosphatase NagD (HAD superfamily)
MSVIPPVPKKAALKRLCKIRHIALDMDGTIYTGNALFPTTIPFLRLLKSLDIGHTFLTNNPSRSVAEYLAHLRDLGIHTTAAQLYTSTQATIDYLKKNSRRSTVYLSLEPLASAMNWKTRDSS